MARPYGDDLRRILLNAYDRGEGTLSELAARYQVSAGWAWKISAQRKASGRAERVREGSGRKLRVGPEVQRQISLWFAANPDLTLTQLRLRLEGQHGIRLSTASVWNLLNRLGVRLKRSHSKPQHEIPSSVPRGAVDPPASL